MDINEWADFSYRTAWSINRSITFIWIKQEKEAIWKDDFDIVAQFAFEFAVFLFEIVQKKHWEWLHRVFSLTETQPPPPHFTREHIILCHFHTFRFDWKTPLGIAVLRAMQRSNTILRCK